MYYKFMFGDFSSQRSDELHALAIAHAKKLELPPKQADLYALAMANAGIIAETITVESPSEKAVDPQER